MIDQKIVVVNDPVTFKLEVNGALHYGWRIVPNSINVTIAMSHGGSVTERCYICVLERTTNDVSMED